MEAAVLRAIAAGSGVNEKGVSRLLGSVRVPLKSDEEDVPPKLLELGFGVIGPLRERIVHGIGISEKGKTFISAAIKEYGNSCPKIVGWIGRGGFDAKSPPAELTKPLIVHACRTAGRLRAKLMRTVPELRGG
jgi:hypothetical protein